MRILVATGLYPPEIGGPATYARLLEEELPGRGIEPTVAPFARVRALPKVVRHLVYFARLLLAGRGVGVLYALDPVSVGLPALLASRLLRVPFVLRVAGDYAWEQARLRAGSRRSLDVFQDAWRDEPYFVRLLRQIEVFVAVRAARVVVPSRYLAGIVAGWGVPAERITVVHSTFSPPHLSVPREEVRRSVRKRLHLSGFVIASAGRLVPWKGFGTLIAALTELPEDCVLAIAGDGPHRDQLKAQVAQRGLDARVYFFGSLPTGELHELIAASDVFALATEYEGLSHVLLEAMALGVPVVTTPAGGNAELVEDGTSGLLVPQDDASALSAALGRLHADATLRTRLGERAAAATEAFRRGPAFDTLAALLGGLASRSHAPSGGAPSTP